MCIILVGRITRQQHQAALAQNKDGFSLFTKEQGLIKSPSKNEVGRAIDSGMFGIWHYRIGTSGRMDKYNVHPFRICKGKYLLYHNGVLGSGLGQMSDTHALADTLYDVTLKTARSVIQSLSHNNRFVIVDAKDPTKFELFGEWVAEAGVLMSHKMYVADYPVKTRWEGSTLYGVREEDDI